MARRELKINDGITTAEYQELIEVIRDPWYFSTFVYLIHAMRGKIPFDLFPFQKRVLWFFITQRFNIVLKFRQAGMTELISMYALWLAMYHSNKSILIISLKERVAKKVLRKIKFMYRNLPYHLRVEIVNGRPGDIGTATDLEFANGSTISSIPTTEDAGRSEALSLLVIDEAAIIKWANQIWAAAWPTLSTGGSAIVNSTPYGIGSWFHKLWVDACAGGNPFNAIRLRWTMHPERDQKWYDEQRLILGPRKTAQEIDGDFLTSGSSVFDLMDIRALEEELDEWVDLSLNPDFQLLEQGKLFLFKNPQPNERYFIGADVATGRSRDYSAFSIMNSRGEEFAAFKGKLSVDKFADLLMKYGKKYNTAEIAPESNDIGLATTTKIQTAGYNRLHYSKALVREKGEKKPKQQAIPGWLTTKRNRPVIIDGLEEDIRNNDCIIKDPFFVQEAYTFIYNEQNKAVALGKDAAGGRTDEGDEDQIYTDDTIMAKAITNHIRKGKMNTGIVAPSK